MPCFRHRRAEAEQVYRETVAAEPTLAEAHYNLATTLYRAGNKIEAKNTTWRQRIWLQGIRLSGMRLHFARVEQTMSSIRNRSWIPSHNSYREGPARCHDPADR
jgi:hypothetical protein